MKGKEGRREAFFGKFGDDELGRRICTCRHLCLRDICVEYIHRFGVWSKKAKGSGALREVSREGQLVRVVNYS